MNLYQHGESVGIERFPILAVAVNLLFIGVMERQTSPSFVFEMKYFKLTRNFTNVLIMPTFEAHTNECLPGTAST